MKMENYNNELNKGEVKVGDNGQTELDFEAADSLQQEEFEKEEIIKEYPILKYKRDLLHKKDGKWFVGDLKFESWLDQTKKDEKDDDLSYLKGFR